MVWCSGRLFWANLPLGSKNKIKVFFHKKEEKNWIYPKGEKKIERNKNRNQKQKKAKPPQPPETAHQYSNCARKNTENVSVFFRPEANLTSIFHSKKTENFIEFLDWKKIKKCRVWCGENLKNKFFFRQVQNWYINNYARRVTFPAQSRSRDFI